MKYDLHSKTFEDLVGALDSEKNDEYVVQRGRTKEQMLYGLFSALFTFFALFGLFLPPVTSSGATFLAAGRSTILGSSLFGFMTEVLQGSVVAPVVDAASAYSVIVAVLYSIIFFVMLAIVASIFLAVFSFVIPRAAKLLAFINGCVVFFSFGSIFIFSYFAYSLEGSGTGTFDAAALTIMIFSGVELAAMFFPTRRWRTLADFLLLTFAVISLVAIFYPGAVILQDVALLITSELDVATEISLILLLFVVALNVIFSALYLYFDTPYLVRLIGFAIQFVVTVLFVTVTAIITSSMAVLTTQPLTLSLLVSSSVAGFFLAAFVAVIMKQSNEEELDEPAPEPNPENIPEQTPTEE